MIELEKKYKRENLAFLKQLPRASPLPESSLSKGLQYLFTFYSKQQKLVKPGSTFRDYQDDSTTLSVGEFIVFCKDFGIYNKPGLSKHELVEIFKINCAWRRFLTEKEFVQTLQHISNKLFASGPKENFSKFLQLIQADDLDYLKKTSRGFNQPFYCDKKNRCPDVRVKIPSDKNLPRVSSLAVKRYFSSKVIKNYQKEVVLPCDAVITSSRNRGYSYSKPSLAHWQTLSSLNGEKVAGLNMCELINEEEDSDEEVLDRVYGSLKIEKTNRL